ncbi:Gfo/Idh/MocA family oxidoreductase [Pedobacter sp. SD-b]|uniref:Gfo/Idh/MocA family oxidoreductase n=1 Tax=Pedobacter segetis TaxID=2793069 RepID=A0ABS1BMN9_9SPHI|nr:Gfo/Idh/MocA family oxidoreductase [Pedobacter segetis]MBK0384145.1 Gfo/Idh/MocA family oxidoreductase [Pedobacter segetis]
MKKIINWGILSTAKIGIKNMIPAINLSNNGKVLAIASRSLENAKDVANSFGIEKVYGSYNELFLDDEIDAIYNPLPNNLHLEYTIKALQHGKHVLCEKPIGLNAKEAAQLNQAILEYPNLKVMEAFMYKFHPQWLTAKKMIKDGKIGKVNSMQTVFSYYNTDKNNIRNKADAGGGALMDIGCYCISFPRFILDQEPLTVMGSMQIDANFGTDFLTSAILNFKDQVSVNFICTTQAFPYQRFHVFGSSGYLEIKIPCNAPLNSDCKIILTNGEGKKETLFSANQYQLQSEAFANCILEDKQVPYPIVDAQNNMKVLEAIKESTIKKTIINL